MNSNRSLLLLLLAAGLGLYLLTSVGPPKATTPATPAKAKPKAKPKPAPEPEPDCPNCPRRPWGPRSAGGRPEEGGKVSPDGAIEIATDLPESERRHNVGGKDGAGLCVFTSIEYAARWASVEQLEHLQDLMRKEMGGGWPEKVDEMLRKYAPGVEYLNDTSGDPALLEAILESGRIPCVTYSGSDGVHYQSSIAHMVCLFAYDRSADWACVADNNFTRDNQLLWMSCKEFDKRWKGQGGGWVVALLAPPPPPVPHAAFDSFETLLCDLPPDTMPLLSSERAFGVEAARVTPNRCILNGRPATRAELLERIGRPRRPRPRPGAQPELPDDGHLLSLTVIGPEPSRQGVLADLETAPQLACYRAALKVKDYDPSHWAVSDAGFDTSGQPAIYLEDPSGKVLLHLHEYKGAEDLGQRMHSTCLAAIRLADPAYNPADDPNGNTGLEQLVDRLRTVHPAVYGVVGLVVYLVLQKEQSNAA